MADIYTPNLSKIKGNPALMTLKTADWFHTSKWNFTRAKYIRESMLMAKSKRYHFVILLECLRINIHIRWTNLESRPNNISNCWNLSCKFICCWLFWVCQLTIFSVAAKWRFHIQVSCQHTQLETSERHKINAYRITCISSTTPRFTVPWALTLLNYWKLV